MVEEKKETTSKVKFLHAVPQFVGKDLQAYGPYEAEEEDELPVELVDVLINKGRVEEI